MIQINKKIASINLRHKGTNRILSHNIFVTGFRMAEIRKNIEIVKLLINEKCKL